MGPSVIGQRLRTELRKCKTVLRANHGPLQYHNSPNIMLLFQQLFQRRFFFSHSNILYKHSVTSGFGKDLKRSERSESLENMTTFTRDYLSSFILKNPDEYVLKLKPVINERHPDFYLKPPGTHSESGAVGCRPKTNKVKSCLAFCLVFTLIYCGGQLSSFAAHMLDEYEIFSIPDEDED